MTNPVTKKVDPSTALAIVLLFVVHTFSVGLSSASHAASGQLDAFGNPLCTGLLGYDGGSSDPTDRHSAPDCCSFGCHATSLPNLLVRAPLLPETGLWPITVAYVVPATQPHVGTKRSSLRSRSPPRRA